MKQIRAILAQYELLFFIGVVIFGFLTILPSLLLHDIPFWYDPARDLLMARDNLLKITLIGPTSGVPGIFYGPYWIWLLSLAELMSKDPRNIAFLVQTLPYFTIFPFLLYRLRHLWGIIGSSALFLLFIAGFKQYALYLWNPYLSPLFLFCIIYLFIYSGSRAFQKKIALKYLLAGFLTGLLLNFHISFGLAVIPGITLYFLVSTLHNVRKNGRKNILPQLLKMIIFYVGVAVAFAPFALFELRHNFQQSKIAVETLISGGSVATIQGLSDAQIIDHFFTKLGDFFSLPKNAGYGIAGAIFMSSLYVAFKKRSVGFLTSYERVMLGVVGSILAVLVYVYLTAKNPVWEYHFIGLEVLYLFIIGVILAHLRLLRWVVCLFAIFVISFQIIQGWTHYVDRSYQSELSLKKEVVRKVHEDGSGSDYSVFTYNPAIYNYDYSYLFYYLFDKDIPYRPELVPSKASPLYIIIPHAYKGQYPGYVRFRAPDELYITQREWLLPDGTIVVKRVKK